MDAILHFFKHLIGLCGEAHPSLIMGGGVFITTMTIYFRQITDYIRYVLMETIATIIILIGMAWVISQPTIMR